MKNISKFTLGLGAVLPLAIGDARSHRLGPDQYATIITEGMKTRFSNLVRFLCVLCLAVFAVAPRCSGQSPPWLRLQFSAGQPTLVLAGDAGSVYAIQYADGLSPTNLWVDRTLLLAKDPQFPSDGTFWTDPSPPSQRFYRAVFVPPPADTNLVFIQPGTFSMGSPLSEADHNSEETQHVVTISRGFWMGKYLVTQGEYLSVVGTNASYFNGDRSGPPYNDKDYGIDLTRPVDRVSWYDATNYCWLRTQQERAAGGIPTNYVYRLPTESEWEYAARAGTTTAFYLGSSLRSGQANFDGQDEYDAAVGEIPNTKGIWLQKTTPVGSYAANAWGLYDMIGNASEWCQDWYGVYPKGPVIDPQGPVSGSTRLTRGGGWDFYALNCRSANRVDFDPAGSSSLTFGFRVVLAPGQ